MRIDGEQVGVGDVRQVTPLHVAPRDELADRLMCLAESDTATHQVLGHVSCQRITIGGCRRQQHFLARGAQADIEEAADLRLVVDHQEARSG